MITTDDTICDYSRAIRSGREDAADVATEEDREVIAGPAQLSIFELLDIYPFVKNNNIT